MTHQVVDLSAHMNQTVERGHPADFPVALRPVFFEENGARREVPRRFAVVREDSGAPLGVVSDRYALVPHQRILDTVEEALKPLDLGPVPRGIYVDRGGARMRAVFNFPTLTQAVAGNDEICPCLQIRNTYDGTSRITVHIGAFRFVCTNLAVGGGGVFAGGFMSVHAGEIPIDEVELPHWREASREDPLSERVVEQMLVGVSTRNYARSLEPVPESVESSALSRSAVSRQFVARTRGQVEKFLSRDMAELDLPVIMLDATGMGDHVLVVALGIDAEGRKHVLGVTEGSTESEQVCRWGRCSTGVWSWSAPGCSSSTGARVCARPSGRCSVRGR